MAAASGATGAFSTIRGSRTSAVDAAGDDNALVGVVDLGPVKKNDREPMVEIENNTADTLTVTVTLADCTQGTLYDNEGDSGCTVTFALGSGSSQLVDIEAGTSGTIPYSVSIDSPGFSLDTSGSVEAQSGNVPTAVRIQHPKKDQDFAAVPPRGSGGNVFEVKKVDVRDDDGDDDLVEVEFEVREAGGSGTVVGEKTVSLAPTDRYAPSGNPAEVIQPEAGYTIQSGTVYSLSVTGTDADGNFNTETVEDTA